jgi:hypothetical protein
LDFCFHQFNKYTQVYDEDAEFYVLITVSIKTAVFSGVAPCTSESLGYYELERKSCFDEGSSELLRRSKETSQIAVVTDPSEIIRII